MTLPARSSVLPSYFGKIPSRADFIESSQSDHALVRHVDRWIADCIHEVNQHDGWQAVYDGASRVNFLAARSDNRSVACGALRPGRDTSRRRYPLIGMLRVEPRYSMRFAPLAPVAFHHAWQTIGEGLDRIMALPAKVPEFIPAGSPCPVITTRRWLSAVQDDYLASEPCLALDDTLCDAGHATSCLAVAHALAGLVSTVVAHPELPIRRGVILPLPDDPLRQPRVASLWLDLVLTALGERPVEVIAMLTHGGQPRLIVSFDETRGSELLAAWMPSAVEDRYVDLTRASGQQADNASPVTSLSDLRVAFLKAVKDNRPCAA